MCRSTLQTVAMGNDTAVEPSVRVLLASSNADLSNILWRTLTHDGRFEVVERATDGDAVVTFTGSYDVAVVDLAISGLGVLGVLERLKEGLAPPTVVVLSTADAIYLRHAAEAEGVADFVVVPAELNQLAERLLQAVSGTSVGG